VAKGNNCDISLGAHWPAKLLGVEILHLAILLTPPSTKGLSQLIHKIILARSRPKIQDEMCNNKIIVLEANKNEIRPGGKLMLALHMKVRSQLKKNAFRAAG